MTKRNTTNSESDSKSEELQEFSQGSEVTTFATTKTKANSPVQDRNYTNNDISAFTQATQGTQEAYETRIVEIETQIDKF